MDNKGSWTTEELNEFATQTNGKPEIETFFEVTEEGNLTTNGFMQMYHLQTQNDPETWNDFKTYKPV
ncbi:NEDD8 activating enzyme [Umbelopsis nana]